MEIGKSLKDLVWTTIDDDLYGNTWDLSWDLIKFTAWQLSDISIWESVNNSIRNMESDLLIIFMSWK